MTDARLWTIGGVLFLLVAVVTFVSGEPGSGAAFVAVGVIFLTMPSYYERRKNK